MELVFIKILVKDLIRLMMSEFDLVCSDGAAALVLVSVAKALELGLTVIAKISGYADAAHVCVLIFLSYISES